MNPRMQGLDQVAMQHVAAAAQALDLGRVDEASRQLAEAWRNRPEHPEVLRMQAGIHSMRGQHPEAIRMMQQALSQRPQDALYHNTMGTLLGNAGAFDVAVTAFRRACSLQPDMAVPWYNLGVMLTRSVRNEEAITALRQAVILAPDHAAARALLGDQLRMRGEVDAAASEYRLVLAEQPQAGMAWWGLADLRTTRFTAADIAKMQAVLQQPDVSEDDLIATGFALGRALDDTGQHAESLAAIASANAVARRRQSWNAATFSADITAINAAFTPPPTAAPEPLGREVIFIVSLPRSGSTLVEQILASHSMVDGAGELPDLPLVLAEESRRRGQDFPQWVGAMEPADWERLGRRYLERTARWRERRPIFIDKLPNNWMYIAAIRAMLPSARIVCCRRDPLETCLSCYRQHLANCEYTRTFEDLAAYWRDFDRSVRHWSVLHPIRVLEHGYEALVADPDVRIRQLLDFCGLSFEPACLNFHQTRREIRSPSATQVRQPLNRNTARAPAYGALLDPLRVALGIPLQSA